MTNEEVQGMMHRLMLLGRVIETEDYAAFCRSCERSEAFSCFFVRPAEYQTGAPRVQAIRHFAEAMMAAQREFAKVKAEFNDTENLAKRCRETNPEIVEVKV